MFSGVFEVTIPDPARSDVIAMLDVQYRMHAVIGGLVGRLFYDGRLSHGADRVVPRGVARTVPRQAAGDIRRLLAARRITDAVECSTISSWC